MGLAVLHSRRVSEVVFTVLVGLMPALRGVTADVLIWV
jgi:hypothetical protein